MKPKVYIESSVVSYLTAWPSRDVVVAGRQAITHDWWINHRQQFDLYVSVLVEDEIVKGDPEAASLRTEKISGIASLKISDDAVMLAERLLSSGAIPTGSEEDALHIGVASAQGMDYLLTWNFRHINNAERKSSIVALVESHGFQCPLLCSPEELGGVSND